MDKRIQNEIRMYKALKKIAKEYMTPAQIKRDCDKTGMDYDEYLEMAYENIQVEAKNAIYGVRNPAPTHPQAGDE